MTVTNTNIPPQQELRQEDELDVKEIWRIIRSYRRSIALIFSIDSDGIVVPERTSRKWDMFRWSNGVRWWI